MKVALITDTHWGCRGDSAIFREHFSKYYAEVFFPYLDEHNIAAIFHLGDIVERRKYINFLTARSLRKDFIEPCSVRGIDLHVITGNHDVFYKNTNEVNAIDELYLSDVYHINVYREPTTVKLGSTNVVAMPWINSGNYAECMEYINNSKAQVLFGHLELQGFAMHKGQVNDHGMDSNLFAKFDLVCSGHYHHKSFDRNVHYLGAPYQITWSDYDDQRGFHVFDTETREIEFIENKNYIFHKIYYNETELNIDGIATYDYEQYRNCFVKVLVLHSDSESLLATFVANLESVGADVQTITDKLILLDDDTVDVSDVEDTPTILRSTIENLETDVSKPKLNSLLLNLYQEAQYT